MNFKAYPTGNKKVSDNILRTLTLLVIGLFLFVGITNCSSSKATSQPPEDFLKNFIAKHETMVDPSLVNFYIKEEQSNVAENITSSVQAKKAEGTLESLQHASFDFSALKLEVAGEKEMYVDDEPKTFLKIAVKGSYTMKIEEDVKTITANNTIILEKEGKEWKVTEKIHPWS